MYTSPKPKRPSVKAPTRSSKPIPLPKKITKTTPKRPVMPTKINPFKMTPSQKAEYLRNPKAYGG
jgi:hypothetical protein